MPAGEFAEIVGELRNHHQLLDGILSRLYCGETASLRPAEVRMLRYLMSETSGLLARLDRAEGSPLACSCHNDRVAG